ncbi:RNA-binding protein EWS [Lemmus lemmus]
MESTDYGTEQAVIQQSSSTSTPHSTQGYPQTTQTDGQQNHGTYGQPTDVSSTRAQTTATSGQTAYGTS